MQVDQVFISSLEESISSSRFNSYRTYFKCENDAEVLGVYMWNKALSSAFYPLLQATEITLRNSIHSNAVDLFSGNKEWYLMNKFSNAKKEANKYYFKRDRKTEIAPRPSPDSVVASLSFGFWVNLLTQTYDDPVGNKKLWPRLIPTVFPNASGPDATRRSLHRRFKFIKDFRNRISHYEPIWKIKNTEDGGGNIIRLGPQTPEESISRLQEYIDLILESLYWISKERHDFVIKAGIKDHIQQICTLEAIDHFTGTNKKSLKINRIKQEFIKRQQANGTISGLYQLATSCKGIHQGKDLIFEIKQIYPPQYR